MMPKFVGRFCNWYHDYYWEKKLAWFPQKKVVNAIVFESVPDVSDNTKAVFDEFIRRKLNRKYKLIWGLNKTTSDRYAKIKNVYYLQAWDEKYKFYAKKARLLISCNAYFEKEHEKQLQVYLTHGTVLKSTHEYYTIPEWIDYLIAASENVVELQSSELVFDKNKIVPLGFPRNDVFYKETLDLRKLLRRDFDKIVVWYPTYRQHHNGFKTKSKNAIPIINDVASAQILNQYAQELNVFLLIKPHFAQDVSYIENINLSNILLITDEFFVQNKVLSYELIGSCDALISDYSSVYYDYTLCNKPVALVWEDIDEYKSFPGLVENYEFLTKGAEKVFDLSDLIDFLYRIKNNVDAMQKERTEIRDFVNISTDGKNSSRVTDFILKKLLKN